MMMRAKIQLSPAEQRLVTNAEIILTKNSVMAKVKSLLEEVQSEMVTQAPTFSKPHIFHMPPKISRGENYLGLPYLVLDYPRIFQQETVFAIRTFFWWGRLFSSTLQLSGAYKNEALPNIEAAYPTFSGHHIGVNPDPWQHHFEPDNYQPIAALEYGDFKKLLHQQSHLKIAARLPVGEWHVAPTFLLNNWMFYLRIVAHYAPPRR